MATADAIPYLLRAQGAPMITADPRITPDMKANALPQDVAMPSIPQNPFGGGGMTADPTMGMPAPSMPNVVHSQAIDNREKLDHLNATGAGVDQIKNPWARGFAKAGDIALTVAAPNIAAMIAGTTLHHQQLLGQQEDIVNRDNSQADMQAQIAQRNALAQQEEAKATMLQDPQKAVDPSKTVTTDDGVFQLNPQTGKYDQRVGDRVEKPKSIEERAFEYAVGSGKNPLDAYAAVYGSKNVKDANLPQQYLDAISSGDEVKAQLIKRVINETSTQPKIDVHAANVPENVGTWTPGYDKDKNPILFNSKTGEVKPNAVGFSKATAAGAKISADEQKRADLAKNMNENIDALDRIARRSPELFGPFAGRLTELRNAAGTNNDDITTLVAIKHQLGMVAQGAHGMRSAQGIESAAKSLVNNFHNSSEATIAALEAARASVRSFTDDANNPGASRGPNLPTAAHSITISGKQYRYSGSGATDDMKNYTEVKK